MFYSISSLTNATGAKPMINWWQRKNSRRCLLLMRRFPILIARCVRVCEGAKKNIFVLVCMCVCCAHKCCTYA